MNLDMWIRVGTIIIAISSLFLNILIMIFGRLITQKILTNDLVHLAKETQEVKKILDTKLETICIKLEEIGKEQAIRRTFCNERHRRKRNK